MGDKLKEKPDQMSGDTQQLCTAWYNKAINIQSCSAAYIKMLGKHRRLWFYIETACDFDREFIVGAKMAGASVSMNSDQSDICI